MPEAGRLLKGKKRAVWFESVSSASFESIPAAIAILIAAATLDFIVGDPWHWPHPVQAMGKVISAYCNSQWLVGLKPTAIRLAGIGLAALLVGGSGLLTGTILRALGWVLPGLKWLAAVILLASCLAGRSLRRAAEEVLEPLGADDLALARERLALYVGRDTQQLTAAEINRAVLETVSENAIDGVFAPLFYFIAGAVVGTLWESSGEMIGAGIGPGMGAEVGVGMAIAYKAASTLDSMVGYREAPYTHLGWASARLEDLLTWLPCRLSVLAIALISGRPRHVLRLCRRDAGADPSPNAGWSECAYAATLGVQLGGANQYRGQLKIKPYLADDTRAITPEVIKQALHITRRSFLLGLTLGTVTLLVISQLSSR